MRGRSRPGRPPKVDVGAIWAITPAKSRARSSAADVERALSAAIRRGHLPSDVLAGLTAYFASDDATRDDGRFVKGVHRMIEADRWLEFHAASPVLAFMSDVRWGLAMDLWNERNLWADSFGPKPGEPGCNVPPSLLIGLRHPDQDGLAESRPSV